MGIGIAVSRWIIHAIELYHCDDFPDLTRVRDLVNLPGLMY